MSLSWLEPKKGPKAPVFTMFRFASNGGILVSMTNVTRIQARMESGDATAQLTIAMKSLARGNRVEAKRHFEQCAANSAFALFDTEWARAYLARLKDPSWPRWLNKPGDAPNRRAAARE